MIGAQDSRKGSNTSSLKKMSSVRDIAGFRGVMSYSKIIVMIGVALLSFSESRSEIEDKNNFVCLLAYIRTGMESEEDFIGRKFIVEKSDTQVKIKESFAPVVVLESVDGSRIYTRNARIGEKSRMMWRFQLDSITKEAKYERWFEDSERMKIERTILLSCQ